MAEFASVFNEIGDLLEEGDEVESSSASDASSEVDGDIGCVDEKLILNLSTKKTTKRKRRRKHRKCRRRRKNQRRRLKKLHNESNKKIKVCS